MDQPLGDDGVDGVTDRSAEDDQLRGKVLRNPAHQCRPEQNNQTGNAEPHGHQLVGVELLVVGDEMSQYDGNQRAGPHQDRGQPAVDLLQPGRNQ